MAEYDLPTMLQYITVLKNDTVLYIGHSQGTLTTYIMANKNPEMLKKVRLFVHLAPVAYLGNMKGLAKPGAYISFVLKVKTQILVYKIICKNIFTIVYSNYSLQLYTIATNFVWHK